jgi:hypothetical protein
VNDVSRLFASTGARGLRTRQALDAFHVLLCDFILSNSKDSLNALMRSSKNVFDFLCSRTRDVSVEAGLSQSTEGKFRRFIKVYVNAPLRSACQLEFTEGSPLHCQVSPSSTNLVLQLPFATRVGSAFGVPRIPKKVRNLSRDEVDPSRAWLIPEKLSINAAPKILWEGNFP